MHETGLITGDPQIKMQYKTFFRDITVKHDVALRNWPLKHLQSPGSMGHSLPAITKLLNLVNSGEVYFELLEAEELQELMEAEEERITSGEVVVITRKTRKDAGTRKRQDDELGSDSDEPPAKKARTTIAKPAAKKASSKTKKSSHRSTSLVVDSE